MGNLGSTACIRASHAGSATGSVIPTAGGHQDRSSPIQHHCHCQLALQWLWLALRYQSLTLPTIANPAITAGGLMGEGKLEYFDGMGPLALSGVRVGATEDLNDSG